MLGKFRFLAGSLLAIVLIFCCYSCRQKDSLVVEFQGFYVHFPDLQTRYFQSTSPPVWYSQTKPENKSFANKDENFIIITSYSNIPETIDIGGRIKFIDLLSDLYFHPSMPFDFLAVNVEVDSNSFYGQYYVDFIPDYPDHFGFLNLIQVDEHLIEVLLIKDKKDNSLYEHWEWVNENKGMFEVSWKSKLKILTM